MKTRPIFKLALAFALIITSIALMGANAPLFNYPLVYNGTTLDCAVPFTIQGSPGAGETATYTGNKGIIGTLSVTGKTTIASGSGIGPDNDSDSTITFPGANKYQLTLGGTAWCLFDHADSCVGIGENALKVGHGGSHLSVAFGNNALKNGTSLTSATAIGYNAFQGATGCANSTAVGYAAGYTGTTQNGNTFVGDTSGYYLTGGYNTLMGYNTTGNSGANFTYTTALGISAISKLTSGSRNSFFGSSSGGVASQGADVTNSMALGANTYTIASNQVVIGDANVTDVQLGQGGKLAEFTPTQSLFASGTQSLPGIATKDNPDAGLWGISDHSILMVANGLIYGGPYYPYDAFCFWKSAKSTSIPGWAMNASSQGSYGSPFYGHSTGGTTYSTGGYGFASADVPEIYSAGQTKVQRWATDSTDIFQPARLVNLASSTIDALTGNGRRSGVVVYNTTSNKVQAYDGTVWRSLW